MRNLTFILLSFAVPCGLLAQAPQFTIQDLGTLPGLPACNGTALDQNGDVVGYCTSEIGQNIPATSAVTHVFLYSKGAMKDLNITSPPSSVPAAVNDSAIVVGGALTLNLTSFTASGAPFIYENGGVQTLPSQLGSAVALGLNDAGQMVATSIEVSAGSANFFVDSRGYLVQLPAATFSELPLPTGAATTLAFGINSSGTVAGASAGQNASQFSPILWQNSTIQTLPLLTGYAQGLASSVNDSGVAAGAAFNLDLSEFSDPNATAHAVLFANGAVQDLGVLQGDVSSLANSVNNAGTVVGFSSTQPPDFSLHLAALFYPPGDTYHAFIYSGSKMYDLTTLVVNGAGWKLSFATQINNAGQIVGTGLYEGPSGTVQHAYLLTPVAGPNITNIVGAGFSTPAVTSISPNGIFTIFGSNLASTTAGLTQADIVNNQLPTNLGGTCVESGTTQFGLFYASPTQINVLAGDIGTSGSVPISVVLNCGSASPITSAVSSVTAAAVSPEFLYFLETANGLNPVAAIEPSGGYVGPTGLIAGAAFAPAKVGDVLTAFGVGWGATTPAQTAGTIAPGAATLTSSYSLTLGGVPVPMSDIAYVGVSPGYAGLYQINFTVPPGVSAGNQPLVLTVDGVATTANAYVAVED